MARDFEDYACMSKFQAEIAAKAFCALGYRKSTDVAREIFEKIEQMIADGTIKVRNHLKYSDFKKKRESEGINDEQTN